MHSTTRLVQEKMVSLMRWLTQYCYETARVPA